MSDLKYHLKYKQEQARQTKEIQKQNPNCYVGINDHVQVEN